MVCTVPEALQLPAQARQRAFCAVTACTHQAVLIKGRHHCFVRQDEL